MVKENGRLFVSSVLAGMCIAVAAFLQNKIKFIDIYKIIEQTLAWAPFVEAPGYLDYVNSNAEARAFAASLIK